MYIPGSSTIVKNISSYKLLEGATNEISIYPEMTIQPNWLIKNKTVRTTAKWVTYCDPPIGYSGQASSFKGAATLVTSGTLYEDLPDGIDTKDLAVDPVIKVRIENQFVINRIMLEVIVGASRTFTLSAGGRNMSDPRVSGYNDFEIDDPLSKSVTQYTPATYVSDLDRFANWWNSSVTKPISDWWKGLTGLEIDPTIVTFIIIAIIAVVVIVVLVLISKSVSGRKKQQQVLAPQYYAQQASSPQSTAPPPPRPQETTYTPPSSPSSGTTSSPFNDGRKRDSARNGNVVDRYRRKTS
jgi:hypothetical protein